MNGDEVWGLIMGLFFGIIFGVVIGLITAGAPTDYVSCSALNSTHIKCSEHLVTNKDWVLHR